MESEGRQMKQCWIKYISSDASQDYSTLIKLHCVEGPASNKLLLTTVEPLLGRSADDEVEMPAVFKLFDATMGKDEISYSKLSYNLIIF